MDPESPAANPTFLHKKQTLELMDQIIDQKKLLFKQLMTAIDTLGSEIDQLEGERQSITSVSATKSLKDCQY